MSVLLQDTTFWTAVSFVLFIILVVWKARGILVAQVTGRIERIRASLKEAEDLRKEAKKILTDLSEELEATEKQVADIIATAKKEATNLQKQSKAKTDEFLARKEANAVARIRQEEASASQEIRNGVVMRSVQVAEAILKAESKKISAPLFTKGLDELSKAKLN